MNRFRRAYVTALALVGVVSAGAIVASPRVLGQQPPPQCLGAEATMVGDNDATPGDGVITGTEGPDVIVGTEGNDVIDAGPGDDRVCGLGGDDHITGGDGFDRVNGGPGHDTCFTERQLNCEAGTGQAPAPAPAPSSSTSSSVPGG